MHLGSTVVMIGAWQRLQHPCSLRLEGRLLPSFSCHGSGKAGAERVIALGIINFNPSLGESSAASSVGGVEGWRLQVDAVWLSETKKPRNGE